MTRRDEVGTLAPWAVLAGILVGGCAVGPDPAPPDPARLRDVTWREGTAEHDGTCIAAADAAWWEALGAPELTRLLDAAVAGNLTLAQARERVVDARARRGVAAAARLPQLDAEGSWRQYGTGDEAVAFNAPRPGQEVDLFAAGITARWELDLWGRIGRLVEAAEAEIAAAEDDLRAAGVSLAAELALAYVDASILARRLAVLERGIGLQERALQVAEDRFAAGTAPHLDVTLARRALRDTRARLPALRGARTAAENRIAILLGQPPQDGLVDASTTPELPPLPALGVPADLLRQRPDVRRAGRLFAAAVARIGAAEAQHYPRFSLSGTLLFQSRQVFDPESFLYAVGPEFSLPLFQGGRIASTVRTRESVAEQARLQFEAALLAALGEVEDAVTGVVRARERSAEFAAAAAAAREAVQHAEELYAAGVAGVLHVVDAQRSLVRIEDDLLVSRQQALAAWIGLYRAFGGGWAALDLRAAPAAGAPGLFTERPWLETDGAEQEHR